MTTCHICHVAHQNAVNIFIQIDFSIQIYTFHFVFFRGHRLKFLNFNIFLSLKIVFIFVNSADPDEMPLYVAFHQGLHCLLKYLFTNVQNEKKVNTVLDLINIISL